MLTHVHYQRATLDKICKSSFIRILIGNSGNKLPLPHTLQLYGRISLWVSWWSFKLQSCLKPVQTLNRGLKSIQIINNCLNLLLPQTQQRNGLCPVCVRSWLDRWCCCIKDLSQNWHWYRLFSACDLRWYANLALVSKWRSQCGHSRSAKPCTDFLCLARYTCNIGFQIKTKRPERI